jgi:hypothetical protein
MANGPLVMVSSVVEGFSPYRESARRAIERAGGQPLLVNEDFPSKAASSRNVCLDAVGACDVYTVVVGERGGWTAPSGKLVVEEEYDEARRLHKPVLAFIQDTARDAEATALAKRLSDYTAGQYRTTFVTPEDLAAQMEAAVREHIEQLSLPRMQSSALTEIIGRRPAVQSTPSLRVVVAPISAAELISPVELGNPDFEREVLEIGHARDVGLFEYRYGTETQVAGDALLVKATNGRWSRLEMSVHESGLIVIESAVQPEEARSSFESLQGFVLDQADIERCLAASLRMSGRLFELKDPYRRHQEFFFNAALLDLGYRSIERDPQPRSSFRMSIDRGDRPIVAYEAPRSIGRSDLLNPASETERALVKIVRETTGGS